MDKKAFNSVIEVLKKIPGIKQPIDFGGDAKNWWFKFAIDLNHHLAWNIVQEFGHVLNYISLEERLPTKFYPISSPPYLNGGPKEYLYWIIENERMDFTPYNLTEWLEGRLPNPIEDENEWLFEDD